VRVAGGNQATVSGHLPLVLPTWRFGNDSRRIGEPDFEGRQVKPKRNPSDAEMWDGYGVMRAADSALVYCRMQILIWRVEIYEVDL
jgi:hypothetical protein